MKKEEIKQLEKGDVITINYGYDYSRVKVIGNNGTHITWYCLGSLKSSAITYSYKEIEERKWSHIGKMTGIFSHKLALF